MTKPDLLRSSRDGDQFHYVWAARQSLRLLDKSSGLHSLVVEAVDRSEEPTAADLARSGPSDAIDASNTGDEVIDLAEYWGSSDIDQTDRVVYRQFKHSTLHADEAWTLSFLSKTLVGFARKYRTLKKYHAPVLSRAQFEFITNRTCAQSALEALNDLRAGLASPATQALRTKLLQILDVQEIADLCQKLIVDEQAPSLLRLRHLLELDVADLLPGAPGDQALLLREMISSRATSIAGGDPTVVRADVLVALKTSEDQLLPAPNLIEPVQRRVERRQLAEVGTTVTEAAPGPIVVHGPGGVGKSVLASTLTAHLPKGSLAVVFDCFGNGSYRRASAPRHRAKQGYVQLVNELAGHALCDPLIPSATADDSDYARTFVHRVTVAAEALAASTQGGLLAIILDAADNAALLAQEMGERSFVQGLVREILPDNVRLVVTCRTERIHQLELPPGYLDIPLRGFDLDETRSHFRVAYPTASPADVSEFHTRSGGNPRVQATILDVTSSVGEALAWLAPAPRSPGATLDSLIERQVAEIRDRQHGSGAEIDAICVGLAALRPMIPVRILAELAGVHASVVMSFVADLGRPLLIDGDSVQFRDEPTETWFRNRFRPAGRDLDAFLERLAPIADADAYVAASLPSLLFEANRFDDLVQLALSDDRLPDSTLPAAQRNELQRREIAQQRTHFALTAALRADRDFEAAQLALRLGALTAGRTRRLDLIRDNTDLAARFLDSSVVEQLVATRSLNAGWPSSNLPIEGALLASADGQTDQARNRLRSAISWMNAWVRQARTQETDSGLQDLDIFQVTWGLLHTDGAAASVRYLRSWQPPTVAFDVGLDVARRLLDAGRLMDLNSWARAARGGHLRLAIAQACAERDVDLDPRATAHLLRPFLRRKTALQPSRHADYNYGPTGDSLHNGLTAITWLITRAVAHDLATPARGAQILRRYLPDDLGHRTGGPYERDVWYLIMGFALAARLEGRVLDPVEIQGAAHREAHERVAFEQSRGLREYRANVEPLVSWATAWLDLVLEPTADNKVSLARLAGSFLAGTPSPWRGERIDRTMVNCVYRLLGRVLARFPDIVDHTEFLEFGNRHAATLSRRTLIDVTRQITTQPVLHRLAAGLARSMHQRLSSAREDAGELALDFVRLARATYRMSSDEAAVHFQAALDITDAIGDDARVRWGALLAIAGQAGSHTSIQHGRAYRLGQIAESVESYLEIDHEDVLAVAAQLSLTEALATASRWRDRRIAPIGDLADALSLTPSALLDNDPRASVALLPLGRRYPDNRSLGEALRKVDADAATSILISYLHFRRASPLTGSALEELFRVSRVSRGAVELVDPSLLWPAPSPPKAAFTDDDKSGASPRLSFVDLDLSTPDGWAKALGQQRLGRAEDDVFLYVANILGAEPATLRAFEACTTTTYWDLSRFLQALHGASLSMAAQEVLDQVLVRLLHRFASDYLLVSWRELDISSARTLTDRDTDYEHVASRALATHPAFTADQAFALATHLGRRLDASDALSLFDSAAGLFAEAAPLDAHDGYHPDGLTRDEDASTAIAAVIWTALGDPAVKTRWGAAHCVQLALTMGHSGVISQVLEFASAMVNPSAYIDGRLEFYARHALEWLLFGISRVTVEPTVPRTAALCEPLLRQVVTGPPHAVNTPLARDSLLRLHAAGAITLEGDELAQIDLVGRPLGVVRHDWHASPEEVASLSDIHPLARVGRSLSTSDEQSAGDLTREIGGASQSPELTISEAGEDVETGSDQRGGDVQPFRFFFDFRQYWCDPLGDAFGVSSQSIEKLVSEVLIDKWAVVSRGRPEDDARHVLDLYPRSDYFRKDEWPDEEDLDFYLTIHALYEVAGSLLARRPVVQRYDEDVETGDSEYSRFLQTHTLSRTDGRWLSDRRDPAPQYAVLEPSGDGGSQTTDYAPHWTYQVPRERFSQEVFPSPEQVVVWGSRQVQHYARSETVQVRSALVTPATAPALMRALQTAPDTRAYRIPDAADEEYISTTPGFTLAGWIRPQGYAAGRDRKDPHAGVVQFPPSRPADLWPVLQTLTPDPDCRLWRSGLDIVAVSTTWGDGNELRTSTGSSGDTLTLSRPYLSLVLADLDRWLILEVEINRRLDEPSYGARRRSGGHDGDERLPFLHPYTKYFLIDNAGAVHEF